MIVVVTGLQLSPYPNLAAVTAVDLQANDFSARGLLANHFRNFQVADQPAELLIRRPAIAGFDSRAHRWVFCRTSLATIMHTRYAPVRCRCKCKQRENEQNQNAHLPNPRGSRKKAK